MLQDFDALDYGKCTRLLKMNDRAALDLLEKAREKFDLIFLDPPYKMDMTGTVERLLKGLAEDNGLIVVEHARETPPQTPENAEMKDHREYGITGLTFFAFRKKDEK